MGDGRVLRVVCFGDSITGEHPRKRWEYQGQYLKFADLLGLMLEGRRGRVEVINSGWAGDRTFATGEYRGAVNRVEEDVLRFGPEVAVVLIGGNDQSTTEAEVARTKGNIETIVRRIKGAGIRVLMLQYHEAVVTEKNEKTAWRFLAEANGVIGEVAKAEGVPVLDMRPVIAEAAGKYPAEEVCDGVDGVHLRLRGEWAYARAVYGKLVELGWV